MDAEKPSTNLLSAIIIAASIIGGALIISDGIRNKKSWFEECLQYSLKEISPNKEWGFRHCSSGKF